MHHGHDHILAGGNAAGLRSRSRRPSDRFRSAARPRSTAISVTILDGSDDLEVVGESFHQDELWSLCGGTRGGNRIRQGIVGVLVPEPHNEHDRNAIAVHIEGQLVGHLPRDIAARYVSGLNALMVTHDGHVALCGPAGPRSG